MGDDVARIKKIYIDIFFNETESVLRLMEGRGGSVNDRIMKVFCGIKVKVFRALNF